VKSGRGKAVISHTNRGPLAAAPAVHSIFFAKKA